MYAIKQSISLDVYGLSAQGGQGKYNSVCCVSLLQVFANILWQNNLSLRYFVNNHPVSEKELGRTLDKLQEENLTNHEFPARHLRLQ